MILVTGHKGYIGKKVYNRLLELGYEVMGIDLKTGEDVLECLPDEQFDFVFHLSALPRVGYSIENPSYTLKQNVLVTSKLLEWSKGHGVKRFIFSSSSAVNGDGSGPNSPYGLHKLMSEMECKLYSDLYKMDTVCLRYYNVFSKDQEYGGAYSTIISAWMEMLELGKPLRLDGDGTQSRDFIHVDDIVDVNLFCMNYENLFDGENFEVGTGKALSINEIKEVALKYNKASFVNKPARPGDVKHTRANTDPLKKIGWYAKIDPTEALHGCFKRGNSFGNT